MEIRVKVRSVAFDYRDPDTPKQREGRSRLRVATRFYQRLPNPLSRESWWGAIENTSGNGFSLFMKLNLSVSDVNGRIGDFLRPEKRWVCHV